jgi:hypothetical protein
MACPTRLCVYCPSYLANSKKPKLTILQTMTPTHQPDNPQMQSTCTTPPSPPSKLCNPNTAIATTSWSLAASC